MTREKPCPKCDRMTGNLAAHDSAMHAPTTREAWFETLDRVCGHWSRNSDGTLTLWFAGFWPQEMHDAEVAIIALGGRVTPMEFDKVCGKTRCTVRAPKDLA